MSQRTVRDDVREHYEQQQLPADTLQRLLSMTEAVEQSSPPAEVPRRTRTLLALAAGLILALATALLWSWNGRSWHGPAPGSQEQLTNAIAEEVSLNHRKEFNLDFPTTDFARLRQQMDKLDFTLLDPQRLEARGLRLLGGRYCSIQGQLAAQLRLETQNGEAVTLYQTAAVDTLAALPAHELRWRGLAIELWQEDGVFLGLARAP